ncbi:hypothetical protein Pmani_015785 [Petrolisthes manimaculis]|uniref:Uncharacterized protein n=1 Tax=Petrolisthes manimaculis TaxID=1843537 RepID=A0AAE1U9H2_9EUCA|nr:hypothetical protein Pmani_015785 [Petrolisthes manimaculis]
MNTFRSKLRRRRDELLRRSSDESDEWQFVPFNPSVYPANNNNNITFNNNDGVGGILLGRMGREGEKEGRGREGKEGDCSSSSPKPALRPWALKRASWHDNYPPVPPHGHGSVVRRSFPLPRPPSRDSSPPPLPPHGQGYPGSVPPWYGAQFLHMASVNYPASVPPGQSRPENVVPKRDAQRVVTESDLTVAVSLNAPGKISASSVPSESSICSSVPKNVKVNTQSHGMGSPLYQEPTATPSTHSSGLTAIRGSFSNALDQSSFPNAASEDVSGPGTSRPNSSGSQPNSTNSMHSFDGVLPKGSQPGSMCSKTIAGIQVSPEGTPPPVPPHGRPTVPPHVGSPKVCVTMSASTLPPMPTVPLPPPPVPAHALTDINQLQKTNNDNLHQIVPSCSQGQEVSQYCPNSLPLNQLQHKYKHESIQSVNLIKCLQENQEHHIQSESAMNPPSQPINQSINKGVRELNSNVPSSVMQNAKTSASKVQSSKLPLSNLKSTSNVPTENPTSPGSPEYKTPVDQLPEYQSPTRGSPPSTTPMRTKKHKIHPPTRSKNRGSAYIPPSQKKKNNIPPTQVQNSRNTFVPPSTSVCAKSHRMGMQSQGSSSASAHNHNQITFPQKPGNTRGSPSIVSTRAQVHNFHTSCQSDSRVSPPTPPQRVVVPPSAPSRSLSADNPSQYFTSRTFSREPPSPALTQRTYSMDNPPPTPTRTVSIENPPPTPTRTLSMENPSLAITPMSYSNDNPDHSVSSNLKQHVTPRTFSTTTGNPTHTRTHSTAKKKVFTSYYHRRSLCPRIYKLIKILKLTKFGKVIMKTGVPRPSKESVLTHQAGAKNYVAEAVAKTSATSSS